ncbi:MAG: metallophosphoesterase family protein [Deltaproteobacteria bacterium]|nr:metallophosphoesterase family protein [Deltaproteobacteria bacterium]
MKIVSFGDIHMAIRQMARIARELSTADLIILSGDLTNFGGAKDARQVVDAARAYCPAVLALPGNLDQPEVIDFLRAEQIGLHGESRRLGDLGLFGCGGSNFTPFHTPLEYCDEELGATLAQAYTAVADAPLRLMVCHTPPHATRLDRLTNGTPVGSPAVRQFIVEHQPDVCITGHIHESPGVDFIGRTKILNAGPFAAGGYIVVRHEDSALEAELKFA